jgi:hypothetical protein
MAPNCGNNFERLSSSLDFGRFAIVNLRLMYWPMPSAGGKQAPGFLAPRPRLVERNVGIDA